MDAILNPDLKAGLGSCFKSWRNWERTRELEENNLTFDSERLSGASAAAIMTFCKGKQSNQRVFSDM